MDAQEGAALVGLERLFTPNVFDIIFPFCAFFLVIILPLFFALYVIFKVVSGHYSGEDGR